MWGQGWFTQVSECLLVVTLSTSSKLLTQKILLIGEYIVLVETCLLMSYTVQSAVIRVVQAVFPCSDSSILHGPLSLLVTWEIQNIVCQWSSPNEQTTIIMHQKVCIVQVSLSLLVYLASHRGLTLLYSGWDVPEMRRYTSGSSGSSVIVRAVYGHGYIVGTTHIIGFGVGVTKTFPGI